MIVSSGIGSSGDDAGTPHVKVVVVSGAELHLAAALHCQSADFSSKFGGLKPRFSLLIQSTARNMLDALRASTP